MRIFVKSKKQFLLIISVLLIYTVTICVIYKNIKKQERALSYSYLFQYSITTTKKISDYIGPIKDLASYITDILALCNTNWSDIQPASNPLLYLLNDYKQFSSIFVVYDDGAGYGMSRLKGDTLAFISIQKRDTGKSATFYRLVKDHKQVYKVILKESFPANIDLLNRPWVKETTDDREIYCTKLYKFYFSGEFGLTLSKKFIYETPKNNNKFLIVGFDVLARDVKKYVNKIKENIKGDLFILDDSLKIIPLLSYPDTPPEKSEIPDGMTSSGKYIYDRTSAEFNRLGRPDQPFTFTASGNSWTAYIRKIDLSNNRSLYLGILMQDHPSPIFMQTQLILLASIILIALLLLYLIFTIREKQKQNSLLIEKNLALANSKSIWPKSKKMPEIERDENVDEDIIKLNSRTALRILDELERLISEKFYLSQDATLYNISKTLGTNTSYLSKIINNYKGKNYSDFVNELRINEAIMRIIKGEVLKKYSLEGFAHELGFKSKSSFNNAFKKYTGVTPSEFIASTKIKK